MEISSLVSGMYLDVEDEEDEENEEGNGNMDTVTTTFDVEEISNTVVPPARCPEQSQGGGLQNAKCYK